MEKLFISLIVVIVLAAGIYFVVGLFHNNPPQPIVTVEGKNIEVAQGSYCWDGLINAQCVDKVSPPDIIKFHEMKPVVVSSETKVKIEFEKEPIDNKMVVNRWINNEETEGVSLKDNGILAPKEKGIYVYDVSAWWERGDSSYVFVIEVE